MFYVYLLASKPYGTLYVGVTSDLVKRIFEHKSKAMPGFTARYGVGTLVGFETHDSIEEQSAGRSRSRNGNASGNST
jgi:putative endonuclease